MVGKMMKDLLNLPVKRDIFNQLIEPEECLIPVERGDGEQDLVFAAEVIVNCAGRNARDFS